ncbi:actinia tenebrosa protease inhibitors-like isoform X2 [Oppia nitens]|uniref:actinia tenebrosa protease inhibitors-like isoform X2 n=1 Tax=Oppia nitens TaxID=1686743 RepID=UPI0023DA6C20|nr:actinia tenebrosa protease inhibitors-like isoform X2 [Oppia nitens]
MVLVIVIAKYLANCSLKEDPGECDGYNPMYAYDKSANECKIFFYTGCGGNDNRFDSKLKCEYYCIDNSSDQNLKMSAIGQSDDQNEMKPVLNQTKEECLLPAVEGLCRGLLYRWYYSPKDNKCLEFDYGGCKGNRNNFELEEHCLETCQKYFKPNLTKNETKL